MKIFISQFGHETNTFSVERTGPEHFKSYHWLSGEKILKVSDGGADYLTGMLNVAREENVELVPGFATFFVGGLILDSIYFEIKENIISALKAVKDEIDGVCLSLHGAAVSESIDDLELDLVTGIREVVGPDMPIMATFDLHGNISGEMAEKLDGIFAVKEYPHIDCVPTGARAMKALIRAIRGDYKPCLAFRKVPMLVPCATASTFENPALEIKQYLKDYADQKGLEDISFFHGFPYADIPTAGASVAVNGVNDAEAAERIADEIAEYLWNRRSDFDAGYLSVEEAMDRALTIEGKPVIINETSDNPGGGTPADGTFLLREMLRRNLPDTCFGFIYDPEFVALAEKAGVGGRVSGLLGGKTDKIHGEPIPVQDAYVKALSDGAYRTRNGVQGYGTRFSIGKTARVVIGNVDVVVASVRYQTMDDMPMFITGINILDYKIVALKSTQHFRSYYEKVAAGIVTADPPGIHTANFSQLEYRKLMRPIYPLDNI